MYLYLYVFLLALMPMYIDLLSRSVLVMNKCIYDIN